MLGFAYGDECEQMLGPFGNQLGPARQRLQRALLALDRVLLLAEAITPTPTLQAARILMNRSIAHALDFDCRVCNPAEILPLARQLEAKLVRTATSLLKHHDDISPQLADQIRLPTHLGGMHVMPPTDRVHAG